MRILYLEDNPGDADLTRRELSKSGPDFEIEIVATVHAARLRLDVCEKALANGEELPYDLALLDMHLPDGSGLSVVSEIRHRSLPIAAVVLTGSGDEESVLTALRSGADDYLVKRPEYWIHLSATLRMALRNFRSHAARLQRPIRLLCVEPNEADVTLMSRHLAAYAPYIHFEIVATGEEILSRLPEMGPAADTDVLLLDYRLPDMNALELLKEIHHVRKIDVPAIINTGLGSEEIAIQATKLGAVDYLVKSPGYLLRLPLIVENAFYRARAESESEALRKSELRLRTIIETEPECLHVLGAKGEILEMNPAGLAMLEAESLDELRGRTFLSFIQPEYRASFLALFDTVMRGDTGKLEFRIAGLKGANRWVDTHAAPMREASGAIATFLGIARDINDRKCGEEQLRQTQKMNAFGQLAGGVAHDFNNQLAAILGYAEMISSRVAQPELKRFANSIEMAAKRSGELTKNLLTFARQAPSQSVPLDVHVLIGETINLLTRTIDKRISVTCRLSAKPSTMLGDPTQIQNALLNLSLNARDAMPGGGAITFGTDVLTIGDPDSLLEGGFTIRLESGHLNLPDGHYLHVSVADTGCGMTDAIKERIFEPFFTTKPIGQGTGMGLASVFGSIKIHHGAITLTSRPDHGTTFHLYLPLSEQGAHDSIRSVEPETRSVPLGILVVDDESILRELLADLLIQRGHAVYTAENGREAVKVYRDAGRKIDLVILDMIMPEMGGREAFRAMREINSEVKVLLSTGYTPNEEIQAILDEGIAGILHKPFTKPMLEAAIHQAMGFLSPK